MRIFITGDTHIPYDIQKLNTKNFPTGKELTKEDLLIICGDFGGVWDGSKEERFWTSWLENKPWTTVFVDGNHEGFPLLNNLTEKEWCNGTVGIVSHSVFHLKRGEIYTLPNELKLFTLGGAISHDKAFRTEGVNWWREKVPSAEELQKARESLDKHSWNIDLIVTHDAPLPVIRHYNKTIIQDEFSDFLNEVFHQADFKLWTHGHLHEDNHLSETMLSVFNDIWEIKQEDSFLKLVKQEADNKKMKHLEKQKKQT